jgi:chromosome partitioning protein
MPVITIASQKGGVGKTTVSLNLACALARRGWRLLLVDLDPQGAIGLSLGKNRKSLRGLAEYLREGGELSDYIVKTRMAELALLPVGSIAMADTHVFSTYLQNNNVPAHIWERTQSSFDLILFDTPAGFSGATLSALQASDFVIGILQSEPIALRSAPQMMEMVASLRKDGLKARLLGFVLTMLQAEDPSSMGVAEAAYAELPRGSVFKSLIHRDSAILAASANNVPVSLMGGAPPAAASAFDQLAAEVEERAGLTRENKKDGEVSFIV